MSMCRVILCVVRRWCLLWPMCSLGKTLLAFAILHFVLQGQTCLLLQVSHAQDGTVEIYKIATPCWTTINRRILDPTGKKKIPYVQGQRMVGWAISCLESNPIPTRNARRAQTKPCVHQYPETPQRLSQTCLWVFECFLWRNRSVVACCGDKGSGCSIPGSHRIWYKHSWRKLPLASH